MNETNDFGSRAVSLMSRRPTSAQVPAKLLLFYPNKQPLQEGVSHEIQVSCVSRHCLCPRTFTHHGNTVHAQVFSEQKGFSLESTETRLNVDSREI